MKSLSVGQKRVLSEFLNTVAVALLTVGVITPLFSKPSSFGEIIGSITAGIFSALFLLALSLIIMERVKS
ncbi:hypothetical protein KKB40_05480 [Patescibacteria group bacterium]|nr:hypothetical protein [Patescibacteria group bacterium]